MFTASLPTWNETLDLYQVEFLVEGSTFISSFPAQVYCGPKRFQPDFEDAPSLITILYPPETSPILRGSISPFRPADPGTLFDVVVFPWSHSPYLDGFMYLMISLTGPRYHNFPNEHCIAAASMISIESKLLWFPIPGPPPFTLVISDLVFGDDDCSGCSALGPIVSLPTGSQLTAFSSPFPWACSPGASMEWSYGYVDSIPQVTVVLSRVGGGAPRYEWNAITTWDFSAPLSLNLVTEDPDTLCDAPSTITVGFA